MKYKNRIKNKILSLKKDTNSYWTDRAKKFGSRSVLNLGHSEDEMENITQMQRDLIFPILEKTLAGNEKNILDFGCGPGRFSLDLANLIHGNCIGVDSTQYLLDLAPVSSKVQYRLIPKTGIIPVEGNSMDVVWICLVLGGIISDKLLDKTANEIDRVLKQNGLIILIENTMDKKSHVFWKHRSIDFYLNLFKNYNLKLESDYYDLGDRISIFMGRKDI